MFCISVNLKQPAGKQQDSEKNDKPIIYIAPALISSHDTVHLFHTVEIRDQQKKPCKVKPHKQHQPPRQAARLQAAFPNCGAQNPENGEIDQKKHAGHKQADQPSGLRQKQFRKRRRKKNRGGANRTRNHQKPPAATSVMLSFRRQQKHSPQKKARGNDQVKYNPRLKEIMILNQKQ